MENLRSKRTLLVTTAGIIALVVILIGGTLLLAGSAGRDASDAETIPIIALTANAFDEDVQRSMQAGLNAHLSKPIEPGALFETLETLIKP